MIEKITVQGFKSLEDVTVELGLLNVFVGANGSGKSNLLEAIGVLSAAADGKVTDQTLLQRGVRPGVPKLYKSAFPVSRLPAHIYLSASSSAAHYDVSLNNPLDDPSPAWRYKTELFEVGADKIASRGPNMKLRLNPENGLAALKAVELEEGNGGLLLLRRLQQYVVFSPTTSVLRGVSPETQPTHPVGLSGGRLPEAVTEFLSEQEAGNFAHAVGSGVLNLIPWAESYGVTTSMLPLSPAASASRLVIRFSDRFMKKGRNVLSGYDASEGALYVLFLAVLAAHPDVPGFCAVDNADHGLNPRLATALMREFSNWIVSSPSKRQILVTSHNPAVLDGLPLQDDRVRLFAVDRDQKGRTVVRRVVLTDRLRKIAADRDWPLSRMWMNKLIGGMPDV